MSNYQQLALYKANDLTAATTTANWSLYTKPSGTFDATETSMYAEVVGLASTTNYGGASLSNQTERYLVVIASDENSSGSITYDSQTSAKYNSHMSNGRSLNDIFSNESVYTFTPNHTSFSALQTDLEDDGKHFISSTYSTGGTDYNVYYLIVDKNSLGSSGGSSGSSSSAANSLMSWAYSSQTSSDPNQIMGWNEVTPTINQVGTPLDWRVELRNKITSSSHDIENLIFDYLVDEEMKSNYTFHEYLAKKGI